MTENQQPQNNIENGDIKTEIRKNLIAFVVSLLVIFLIFAAIAYIFKNPIRAFVEAFVGETGFWGMCLISFVSGLIVTPIPQETFIFMIQKSHLNGNWAFYVFVFGLVSLAAGQVCWFLGSRIGHTRLVQKMLGKSKEKVERLVSKYGFWGVLIGVFSPLPFSVVCWTAGIFEISWLAFTFASAFRILRFFLMYYALTFT